MQPPRSWRPSGLPIDSVLPAVTGHLRQEGRVVLHAPPGAGKTTIVPLALLDEPWLGDRRIVLLEPRRLAARAAAYRMSHLMGEAIGGAVGYRTRLDSRVSAKSRIEVVTEGILNRMVQDDPTLDQYGAVIFDEFHERSLNADLGLALVWHSRRLVRPDLRVVVMSATLDGTTVARLLDHAPVVKAVGAGHGVETRYRPLAAPGQRIRAHEHRFVAGVSGAIRDALLEARGDLLAFLPGAPEIRRVEALLRESALDPSIDVLVLHGSMRPEEQDRAIRPSPSGRRKVVLATSIAETSLTIDGVRIVVDAGLARRPRFAPRTGMSRLETQRVSLAAADQRRGRAGRTAPGVCIRLWHEEEDAGLLPFVPPEIVDADLAPLALDLAVAGVVDPSSLDWLDQPPPAALAQARELLRQLEAIDDHGRATDLGAEMARLGMHPRLSHMVLRAMRMGAGTIACELAALLGERDLLHRVGSVGTPDVAYPGVDVQARIDALRGVLPYPSVDRGALKRVAEQARRWHTQLRLPSKGASNTSAGLLLAFAFPDRVAQRRPGAASRYVLRNGTGALLPDGDPLVREPFLVVAETDGKAPEGRIYLAASLDAAELEVAFASQVVDEELVEWDDERGVRGRRERRLGAIVLDSSVVTPSDAARISDAVSDAIRRHGLDVLPWSDGAIRLRERLAFLHRHDDGWPDVSDAALAESLLAGMRDQLGQVRSREDLQRIDVQAALRSLPSWQQRAVLDRLAPTHYVAPTGSRLPIDYANPDAPTVSVRLQEMFGCETTPTVFDRRVPVTLHLLSPASRPVQVTRDLAGFWRSSYFDVRKDLRARYPKHPWPDDPLAAPPTTRAKRRG